MAAYVSVPRDLSRVKEKVMFNLTKRQLICFSVAAVVGVPLFFGVRAISGNVSAASLAMIVIMMPLFFMALYEKNGQPFEVILWQIIQYEFIRPKIRVFQTDNIYIRLLKFDKCRNKRSVYRNKQAGGKKRSIVYDKKKKRKK